MSAITIRSKLKTILDTVSASVLPLKYNYGETLPTSFPAGMILYRGEGEEEQIDTVNNLIPQRFIIRIVFPMAESETFETKRITLVDTIKDEFRKDDHQTLTGSAINVRTGEVAIYETDQYVQPVVVCDILLTISVIKPINA